MKNLKIKKSVFMGLSEHYEKYANSENDILTPC